MKIFLLKVSLPVGGDKRRGRRHRTRHTTDTDPRCLNGRSVKILAFVGKYVNEVYP